MPGMDIRKFFAPKGGSKKKPAAAASAAPAASAPSKKKQAASASKTASSASSSTKATAARRKQVRPEPDQAVEEVSSNPEAVTSNPKVVAVDDDDQKVPDGAVSSNPKPVAAAKPDKKKKKRMVLLDDDDEDEDDEVVPDGAPSSSPTNNKKKTTTTTQQPSSSSDQKKRKPVSVHDFFSNSQASPRKKTKKPEEPRAAAKEKVQEPAPSTAATTTTAKRAAAPVSSIATGDNQEKEASLPSPRKKAKTSTKATAVAKKKSPTKAASPKKKNKKQPKPTVDEIVPQATFDVDQAVPECLLGVAFCFTGILGCQGEGHRDALSELVKTLGGRVTTAVSSKTDYLVAGPVLEDGRLYTEGSKYKRAMEVHEKYPSACTVLTGGIPQFYGLLQQYSQRATAAGAASKETTAAAAAPAKVVPPAAVKQAPPPVAAAVVKKQPFVLANNPYARTNSAIKNPYANMKKPAATVNPYAAAANKAQPGSAEKMTVSAVSTAPTDPTMLWVDKYKPQSTQEILGNGDNVKKLTTWLQVWEGRFNNPQAIGKAYSNPKGPWKAALLSGPPGIGKTTAATLVAKQSGRDVLEFNASDVRSKKAMKEHFGDITGSQTISFGAPSSGKAGGKRPARQKRVIIMDEVDGMGAGDRSGMAELIQMIKFSQVPIICICNDRQAQKIRSLVPYCLDLRFRRPVKSVIVRRAVEIARREGLSVEQNAAEAIAESCGNDVRQVLNALQMWASSDDVASNSKVTYKNVKERGHSINKDEILRVSLFDAARIILEGPKGMQNATPKQQLDSFFQRNDAFFVDYNFTGLLVQQNYLGMAATQYINAAKTQSRVQIEQALENVAAAADSMSDFALAEGALRGIDQNWSLLPVAGMFAVKTGYHASGENGTLMKGFPQFSSWLGRNSTFGKKKRLLGELHHHTNFRISGGPEELRLAYLPMFRDRFFSLLSSRDEGGVDVAIDMMDEYGFDRDDVFEKLDEFKMDPKADSFSKIESKKKAAITRAYNSRAHRSQALVDEQASVGKKKKRTEAAAGDLVDPDAIDDDKAYEQEEENDDEEEDEKKIAAMFKKKGRGRGTKAKPKTSKPKRKK